VSSDGAGTLARERWATLAEPRTGAAVVGLLAALRGLLVLVQGAPFLTDDFIYVYGRRFEGWMHTSAEFRLQNRPGSWLTQTVLFGLSGASPVVLSILVTLLNVGAAVALYFAVRRFFPHPAPLLVAGLWVLLPAHSTFTVWGSAAQGIIALTAAFCGLTLLSKGRWGWALLLFSCSLLFYELEVATVFAASVLVGTRFAQPLEPIPAERRIRPWQRAVMVVVLLVVTRWMARNPTFELEVGAPNAMTTWSGHVGYGLLAHDAGSALLLRGLERGTMVALAFCAVLWLLGDRDRDRGPSLALVGVVVMALGLVLVVAVPAGLYGMTNRLYGASSVGVALIFVGIGQTVWHRARVLAAAGAVALVALCLVGQLAATRGATRAGQDVAALIDHLRTFEDPANTVFVVELGPDRNGFVGIDHWFDLYPYKLAFPEGTGNLEVAPTATTPNVGPGEVLVTWDDVLGGSP
jgi:hypothetical protein